MNRSRIRLSGGSQRLRGLAWEFDANARVGSGAELLLIDPSVGALHAELICDGPWWFVRDLGSRTGTFLNGQRVGEVPEELQAQDVLRLGAQSLRVTAIVRAGGRDDGDPDWGTAERVSPPRAAEISP